MSNNVNIYSNLRDSAQLIEQHADAMKMATSYSSVHTEREQFKADKAKGTVFTKQQESDRQRTFGTAAHTTLKTNHEQVLDVINRALASLNTKKASLHRLERNIKTEFGQAQLHLDELNSQAYARIDSELEFMRLETKPYPKLIRPSENFYGIYCRGMGIPPRSIEEQISDINQEQTYKNKLSIDIGNQLQRLKDTIGKEIKPRMEKVVELTDSLERLNTFVQKHIEKVGPTKALIIPTPKRENLKLDKTPGSAQPTNKVVVNLNPGAGNSYVICGQGGGLSWEPKEGKPLQAPRNQWSVQLPSVAQEFKVVLVNKDGSAIWQDGANLSLKDLQNKNSIQFGSQTAKIAHDASNKLTVSFEPKEGASLVLCGLGGNWNPSQGLALNTPNDQWSLELPKDVKEYKIVLRKADGSFVWEQGPNRTSAKSITEIKF